MNRTAIHRIDAFQAVAIGPYAVGDRIARVLATKPAQAFWLHLDVGVMDAAAMPAVDSPGSPGIDPVALAAILAPLVGAPRCPGMTVTVYDPDLDPDRRCARLIVALLAQLPFPRTRSSPERQSGR